MTESDFSVRGGRYIVAQIERDWHVLFEANDLRHQFLSVARFQDFDRAKNYAEIEGWMNDDADAGAQREDVHAMADLAEVKPQVRTVVSKVEPEPDLAHAPSQLEHDVLADLPRLMADYPFGVSAKELAERFGEPEHRCRSVMRILDARKRARLAHWPDDQSNRLTPLDYERPMMRLTETQAAVLGALRALAVDGLVQASARTICEKAPASKGSIIAVLDALRIKGFIEIAIQGNNGTATTYRLLRESGATEHAKLNRVLGLPTLADKPEGQSEVAPASGQPNRKSDPVCQPAPSLSDAPVSSERPWPVMEQTAEKPPFVREAARVYPPSTREVAPLVSGRSQTAADIIAAARQSVKSGARQ